MERTQLTAPPLPSRPAKVPHEHGDPHRLPPVKPHGDADLVPDHDKIDLNVKEPRPAWVIAVAAVVVLGLGALLLTGLIPRHAQNQELQKSVIAEQNAPVMVNVAQPKRAAPVVDITLPGTLRPWQEVSLFARTSGYLHKFYVDISNHVEAGQLLAVIETPEVDQELRQSQAALLQAKASVDKATADRDLAKVTWQRTKALQQGKYVSQQDADEKQASLSAAESTLEAAKANVASAQANVQRLTEMQQFARVTAPFAGVITGRGYDVGSLITANPTTVDVKPLFKIAENDVLRAFVNVPQSSALEIKKGMTVQVTARQRPGRTFAGTVMGTTNYLDPTSRSLLTEVKVVNQREPDGEFALLPGMYIQAAFQVHRDAPPLIVPGPAVVNNASGTRVAIIKDDKAHFVDVTLGQDFGSEIEITGGLKGDEQVIANPGERTVEGAAVSTGND